MELLESLDKLEIDRLVQFEEGIGTKLPSEYGPFLLRNNGGITAISIFDYLDPWTGEMEGADIHQFFGISDRGDYTLQNKLAVYKDRIPSRFLPIANTSTGDVVCLALWGKDTGRVYIWKHEIHEVWAVSNTFGDFINSLHESG